MENIKQTYTTSINVQLLKAFKRACINKEYKQNEALEMLMLGFVEGRVTDERNEKDN